MAHALKRLFLQRENKFNLQKSEIKTMFDCFRIKTYENQIDFSFDFDIRLRKRSTSLRANQ